MQKSNFQKQNGFLKSVFVLSVGGIVAKVLGAIYRIPLTNLVGSYGMGYNPFARFFFTHINKIRNKNAFSLKKQTTC